LTGAFNLVWDLDLGATSHRILAGADVGSSDQLFFGRSTTAGVPNLSLVNPVYGLTDNLPYRTGPRPLTSDTRSIRRGFYLQDQMSIGDRFIVVGGLRHDRFEDRDNRLNKGFSDRDTTFRVGVIGRPRPDISIYGMWSNSFEPQAIGSQDPARGGPFAPQTGNQVEIGAKTALQNGRIRLSAALYQIRRRNLLQVDPSLPPVGGLEQLAPIGEVRSRGFELETAVDITPDWVVTGNYGYNDTIVTADNGRNPLTNAVGDRFANAPEHRAGFWTRYQVPAIRTAFAFGGEYVSERLSLSGQRVRPYTIFDASIIHDIGLLRVLLRVDNIFDRTYAASGFIDRTGHFPGEPRTVLLEGRLSF
jgi:iron complex outermembrane receptor protein